jgi:hypothetical protein
MALAEQMSLRPDLALGAPPGIPVPSWANEMDYQDGYRDPMVNEPRTKSDSIAAAMEAFELGDDDEYDPLYPSTCSDSLVPGDSMSNVGRAPRNYEGNDDDADTGMPVGPPVDDGWGNAPIYIYETEKPLNWRRPGQPTDCPEHGIRCPKGMCRFQAQKKANERRRQEEAERQAQRKEQREKNIKRSERKNGTVYHVGRLCMLLIRILQETPLTTGLLIYPRPKRLNPTILSLNVDVRHLATTVRTRTRTRTRKSIMLLLLPHARSRTFPTVTSRLLLQLMSAADTYLSTAKFQPLDRSRQVGLASIPIQCTAIGLHPPSHLLHHLPHALLHHLPHALLHPPSPRPLRAPAGAVSPKGVHLHSTTKGPEIHGVRSPR